MALDERRGGWNAPAPEVCGPAWPASALTIGVAALAIAAAAPPAEGVLRGAVTCRAVRDCQGAVVYVEQVPGQSYRPRSEALLDHANSRSYRTS